MWYVMMGPEKKQSALETLLLRKAEIEAAIKRLEDGDETVLLEPATLPEF